jgi:hypothetical protein
MEETMGWKKLDIPAQAKLFKIHTFGYLIGGHNYSIEIDEYADGQFVGFAEQSNDASTATRSCTADSIDDCLQRVLQEIASLGS